VTEASGASDGSGLVGISAVGAFSGVGDTSSGGSSDIAGEPVSIGGNSDEPSHKEGAGPSSDSPMEGEGDGWADKPSTSKQVARDCSNQRIFNDGSNPISEGVTLADGLRVAKNFRMSEHIFVEYRISDEAPSPV